MVENGARKLVYLPRSAGSALTVREALFRESLVQGCEATVVQADVANIQDMQKAVRECNAPIAGIFQMSMVLEVSKLDTLILINSSILILPRIVPSYV
jgi:hypothetical protein